MMTVAKKKAKTTVAHQSGWQLQHQRASNLFPPNRAVTRGGGELSLAFFQFLHPLLTEPSYLMSLPDSKWEVESCIPFY